ncbi:MAG TPA: hypothetical protein VGK53_24430 [Propionicimonas sp.]
MTTRRANVAISVVVLAVGATLLGGCAPTAAPSATARPPAVTAQASAPAPTDSPTSDASPAATESNPPGDIPDNQAFVTYQVPNQKVSVKVPEGWARTESAAQTTFTDKLNSISISVGQAQAQPTPTSVTAEASALRTQVRQFAMGKVTEVSRAGQKVILLTYKGDSSPDQVTGKVIRDAFERYTFTNGGRRLDLTLSGPENADNVDPWKIVSESVTWK